MKFTIDVQISERDLIESLLNMKHSGVEDNYLILVLGITALAERWHIDKLSYYLNLLEIER